MSHDHGHAQDDEQAYEERINKITQELLQKYGLLRTEEDIIFNETVEPQNTHQEFLLLLQYSAKRFEALDGSVRDLRQDLMNLASGTVDRCDVHERMQIRMQIVAKAYETMFEIMQAAAAGHVKWEHPEDWKRLQQFQSALSDIPEEPTQH